ncbi:hypothetical protein ANCDUO_20504 [Ancylostoma duodenale]|uniref:Uncharacterized protein n=1 Tax=Ancylostoma duodenale TaxID=51022 RepID=A0A0C2CI15_9BILA|nr:hypothetical protein ANCDUO_20504 [Ancylostoma duodenale]
MNTKDALLIVCDPRDKELGIGMDENQFLDWMAREKADSQMVEFWMKNETAKPPALGGNQMGLVFFLMWLRFEVREKRKAAMLNRQPLEIEGLSTDNDDNPIKIKVNDQIISLQVCSSFSLLL